MADAEARWLDVLAHPGQLDIVRSLVENGEATATELAHRCHLSEATLRRHLEALVELAVVRAHDGETDGMTPGRPATTYTLAGGVRDAARELLALLKRPIGFARERTPAPPWTP
jgi:predicted ArsR family transcriptional regulator